IFTNIPGRDSGMVITGGRLEPEGHRVQAVPEPGGGGPVVKHMAEMAAAPAAGDLGANHAQTEIPGFGDIARLRRGIKTRPATTGIKLGGTVKKRGSTAHTVVAAVAELPVVLAAEGALSAFFPAHGKLLRGEGFPPIALGFGFPICHCSAPLGPLASGHFLLSARRAYCVFRIQYGALQGSIHGNLYATLSEVQE